MFLGKQTVIDLKTPKMKSDAKGQLQSSVYLEASHIILTQQDKNLARVSVDNIKLIGEYTNAEGPFVDDWFIVFITSEIDWTQISAYTPGMQELLQKLSTHFDAEIVGSLFASTSWKTNIIWPPQVAGQEMWNVVTDVPTTLIGRLKKNIGFAHQQLLLTEAAASIFR